MVKTVQDVAHMSIKSPTKDNIEVDRYIADGNRR